MKKQDLVRALSEHSGETQAVCGRVLDALTPVATGALIRGQSVGLSGLGKITLTRLQARTFTPPGGEPVDVPARPAVRFRPAQALKDVLNRDDAPREVLA